VKPNRTIWRWLPFLLLFGSAGLSRSNAQNAMTLSEQFRRFGESHPITRLIVAGNQWSFITSGSGDQTVVVLPGGGGDADSMFPVVSGLEGHCRVIATGYPSTVTSSDQIVEGIKAILDECGVDKACLLGHSLGGAAARAFAQRYPERADSLVIANFAPYSPGRRLLFKALLPIMAHLPRPVVRRAVRSAFNRLLKDCPKREFWLWYVNQCEMMQPGSKGMRSQVLCLLDFVRKDQPAAAQTGGWTGRVLILESDHETGFTRRERRDLRALYPAAAVHVFQNAGHASFITHTDEFVKTVAGFLAEKRDAETVPKPL
jgi:esterase